MDVIIFNTKFWDRSINALWKSVVSVNCDSNWRGFKLPEDFRALMNFLTESAENISSLTLLGSFRNWSNIDVDISETLKEIFMKSTVPRVWLFRFDLHHSINDLLHGTKTSKILGANENSVDQINPTNYFDALAWPYEHSKFIEHLDASLFDGEVQLAEAEETLKLAKKTWLSLRNYFPSRLPFYHCLDLDDFSKFKLKHLLSIYYIGIPGTLYETRCKVRDYFISLGVSVTPSNQLSKLFDNIFAAYLRLFKYKRMDSEEIVKLKRKISYFKLSKICQLSRFIWVDGSYLDYPVRKYFEIPALNGLLISPKNASIETLDLFEDWQFTTPEGLLKSNPKSKILNGLEKKKLVELQKSQLLRCHTAEFRLNSLATYIRYYKKHLLIHGYYKSGKLILESNGKILHELY